MEAAHSEDTLRRCCPFGSLALEDYHVLGLKIALPWRF
jgi:hypothetical protein